MGEYVKNCPECGNPMEIEEIENYASKVIYICFYCGHTEEVE